MHRQSKEHHHRIRHDNRRDDDAGEGACAAVGDRPRPKQHDEYRKDGERRDGNRRERAHYSEVVGSIMVAMRETRLAGKPPLVACSRTVASSGAM